MFVRKILFVVRDAPLRMDGSAATDDACQTVGRVRDEGKEHPSVDCKVVHTLLGLLDEGVAEDLPSEVLGDPIHLREKEGPACVRHLKNSDR